MTSRRTADELCQAAADLVNRLTTLQHEKADWREIWPSEQAALTALSKEIEESLESLRALKPKVTP